MSAPISWCDESLVGHQAVVAVAAWAAYGPEWVWAARAAGVPGWALTLAAAGHDAGKALPCLQEGARRACMRRDDPSFKYHEYASGYALASLALAAKVRGMDAEAVGLAVASLASLLHHHGMTDRLESPLEAAGWIPGPARPPRGARRCGRLGFDSMGGLRAMLGPVLESCRLAERLAGRAGVRLEPCPRLLEELAQAVSSRPPPWGQAWERGVFGVLEGAGARARAAVTVAAAAVSVADTLAASAARGSLSPGRTGGACGQQRKYALRLLCENPARLAAVARALDATAGVARL